jgi:acetyl esterase/lipase
MSQAIEASDTGIAEPVEASVLADTRRFNDEVERLLGTQKSIHLVPPEVTRQARREGRGPFPPPVFDAAATERVIPGRAGDIPLRILTPDGAPTGVYLHIHGGGWTLGAHDMQDPALRLVVESTGMCVVSVGYRLAPEHPYPAGPDDCENAALWLLGHGLSELHAPARICIGGESAGAHLAVVTLLRLRDRHGVTGAVRAANLVYGAFDLSMTPSQRRWGDRYLVLSGPIMRFFGDCFLPDVALDERRDPDVSPLYADLRNMPPGLFTVGMLDPLLDDSLFMAARWRAAGNRARLRVWPEAVHGFTMFPIEIGRASVETQLDFLRAALD